MITRRLFTFGLLAAPAIVHAGNLMPVKKPPARVFVSKWPIILDYDLENERFVEIPEARWQMYSQGVPFGPFREPTELIRSWP